MRKIEIQDKKIGRFVWEIPENLNDFLTESSELSEKHKEVIDDVMRDIENLITSFLCLITGALLSPSVTAIILPKISDYIQTLLRQALAEKHKNN